MNLTITPYCVENGCKTLGGACVYCNRYIGKYVLEIRNSETGETVTQMATSKKMIGELLRKRTRDMMLFPNGGATFIITITPRNQTRYADGGNV